MTSQATSGSVQRAPELAGQTVVVIGGTSGIGLETARRARAEGADVVITGRNPDRLARAAQEVGAQRTAAFDATDAAAMKRFFQDLPAPIDHVMVTAGFVDTPLSACLLGDQLEERRNELRAALPIGRVVGPADVAALAVHIMTNTALTGATYDIDGEEQFV
jgi:NAD(P)-dependent dehydrogenase (short-subunit alcohol dehydrogenase family)